MPTTHFPAGPAEQVVWMCVIMNKFETSFSLGNKNAFLVERQLPTFHPSRQFVCVCAGGGGEGVLYGEIPSEKGTA